ncbi:hypothetical protein D3C81_1172880 [compost metagenome]
MHDQHARRTAARGFLELVGPAAVVGHCLAVECTRCVRFKVGIVDQHHGDLAGQVHALVIVPMALRCGDAVTDEHQRHILLLDHIGWAQALQRHVLAVDQRLRPAAQRQTGSHLAIHRGTHQRHFLHPAAVLAARLQARLAEFFDQVIHGALLTLARRCTTLEFIGGEDAHMPRQGFRIDTTTGKIIGCIGDAADEQAGRKQQDAHRVHGRYQQAGRAADSTEERRERVNRVGGMDTGGCGWNSGATHPPIARDAGKHPR